MHYVHCTMYTAIISKLDILDLRKGFYEGVLYFIKIIKAQTSSYYNYKP